MLIEEAKRKGARQRKAYQESGISERTFQLWKDGSTPLEDQRPAVKRPAPKNKLSEQETKEILTVVNRPEFQSLPSSQIVPILADKGVI